MTSRVFYVDDEEDLVWSTTRQLARERPDLIVNAFTEPLVAFEALKENPPDVLITDLRMEGMSGLELLVAARRLVPELPVIVVTAYGGPDVSASLRRRSLVEYLEKPVRFESLVASIDRLLAHGSGFSGAISLPMLPDLIQVYTLSLASGALSIRRGDDSGTIWFERGRIVHAVCGDRSGEVAVYNLLAWQGGDFSLDTEARPTERTIDASWQELLLEGCRLLDEAERDSVSVDCVDEDPPSTQVVIPPELASKVASPRGAADDATERDRESSRSAVAGVAGEAASEEAAGLSEPTSARHEKLVAESLAMLTTIDGFVGAAVFDADAGSLLGTEGGGAAFDLGVAAAGNAEVLGAVLATVNDLRLDDSIADIVITIRRQCHLIRPLSQRTGVFVYLVLERAQSNLALARLRLAEAERSIAARST